VCTTRLATVVVEVDDAGGRLDPLRDLVHVVRGREPGTDIQQLPEADLADQVTDDPAERVPLSAHPQLDRGIDASIRSPVARSAAKLSLPE
jgi:hypothetical protein